MTLRKILISLLVTFSSAFMNVQTVIASTSDDLGWDSSSVQYILDHKEEFKYNWEQQGFPVSV